MINFFEVKMTEQKFNYIIYNFYIKSVVLKRSFLFSSFNRFYGIRKYTYLKQLIKERKEIILKNKKEHTIKSFLFFGLTLFFIIFINLVKI